MRATITMCHKFVDLSKQGSRKAGLIGGEGGLALLCMALNPIGLYWMAIDNVSHCFK